MIPFDHALFEAGGFKVITRQGLPVDGFRVDRFSMLTPFMGKVYLPESDLVIHAHWFRNGKVYEDPDKDSIFDLFMVEV